MDNRAFLRELNEIKDEINRQIDPTNRFEQYETCPIDADQDEVDRLFTLHEKHVAEEQFLYGIYKHLNELFTEFLATKNTSALALTPPQKEEFAQLIDSSIHKFSRNMERIQRLLHRPLVSDEAVIRARLSKDSPQYCEKLFRGETLCVDDHDLARRFPKDFRLAEHREIMRRQFFNPIGPMSAQLDMKHRDQLNKAYIISGAAYLERAHTDVGYCDENTTIGLLRIFRRGLVSPGMTIEKLSVSYEEGDGHTFLAINRNPSSNLGDFSSWGKHAIIFDPWNKLVCMAADFASLPTYYFSYPDAAKWMVQATFTESDYPLLHSISNDDMYFAITENQDLRVRAEMVTEEYELTSLDQAALQQTKAFLVSLLEKTIPDNFKYTVNLYLTTGGIKPVQIVNGLEQPAIAIHKDLLVDGAFTIEECEFAIAHALLVIKCYPCSESEDLLDNDHNNLDIQVVNRFKNAESAISFLKKCVEFARKHHSEDLEDDGRIACKLPVQLQLFANDHRRQCEAQRAKHIATLQAQDERLRVASAQSRIPQTVCAEVNKIEKYQHLAPQFHQCQTNIEKIHYLQSHLPDLWRELKPYESIDKPSARVREFCHLLRQIQVDFADADQAKAVDDLINAAFCQRIPAFDLIYRSVQNAPVIRDKISKTTLLKLGIFKDVQQVMDKLIKASNRHKAHRAAEKFLALYNKIKNHFVPRYLYNESGPYNSNFRNENGRYPRKEERYFGSTVAHYIQWRSFTDNCDKESLPWDAHIRWAAKDATKNIANALWNLGVVRDRRLWKMFDNKKLLGMMNIYDAKHQTPITCLPGRLQAYSDDHHIITSFFDYVRYSAANHKLVTFMLDNKLYSPEEAFKLFFDKNLQLLLIVSNNDVSNCLLAWFMRIVAKNKELVKSFFLGREDGRDLRSLQKMHPHDSVLDPLSPYVKFFLLQRFKDVSFKLFTSDEILKLISFDKGIHFFRDIPPELYLGIFELPYTEMSLSAVQELVPMMARNGMGNEANSVFHKHIETYRYGVVTREAAQLCELLLEHLSHPIHSSTRKKVLASFRWQLPARHARPLDLDVKAMITVYRTYDINLGFADRKAQREFGHAIYDELLGIVDVEMRLTALEDLLLGRKGLFETPISDLWLRDHAVLLWVQIIVSKYGKDDGTQEYYNKLKPIIELIAKNAPNRDKIYIYNLLADAIESQRHLSDYMGMIVEPEKYEAINKKNNDNSTAVGILGNLSMYLGKDKKDQFALLDFLSAPVTQASVNKMAIYLDQHDKTRRIAEIMGYGHAHDYGAKLDINAVENLCYLMYQMFWDRTLSERAVIVNYLLLPPDAMVDPASAKKAYLEAFDYIVAKLLPDANNKFSDENFALAFLTAYLNAADEFTRSYLLTALLVASNESSQADVKQSIGKKVVLLCENMGPAYVKLAQAIHSHPNTPENIRKDLEHVKGRANPPYRWQLWRMIVDVLPEAAVQKIHRVRKLLGSASYNLVMEVQLINKQVLVLSLLRENAKKQTEEGFDHLQRSVAACNHERLGQNRGIIASMIKEADLLSVCEMDHQLSSKQFALANKINRHRLLVDGYRVIIFPTQLYLSGKGYRFIELMKGVEFNHMPADTHQQLKIKKCVAKAVLVTEFINIMSGEYFDCDRHGNQLRVNIDEKTKTLHVGLYDFGELSLQKPTDQEIVQFAIVIKSLAKESSIGLDLTAQFDNKLSDKINELLKSGKSASYLMRVRKGLLALHDFQAILNMREMMEVLSQVIKSKKIHNVLRLAMQDILKYLQTIKFVYDARDYIRNGLFFGSSDVSSNKIIVEYDIQGKVKRRVD